MHLYFHRFVEMHKKGFEVVGNENLFEIIKLISRYDTTPLPPANDTRYRVALI